MFCQSPMCLSRANPYFTGSISFVAGMVIHWVNCIAVFYEYFDVFGWLISLIVELKHVQILQLVWAKCSELKFSLFKNATKKFFPLFHVLRLTISSTSRVTRLPKMQHRQRSQALAPHMPVGPWVWWELRLIHRNVQELAGILNPSL